MMAGAPLVLVVEREGQGRELVLQFLRDAGWQVACAADGEAGWQRTQELKPDLVMSEILIPKLDGLALCRRIRCTPTTSAIPVLIVSMLAASARAHDAGATGFLTKPLSHARLVGEASRLVPEAAPTIEERA